MQQTKHYNTKHCVIRYFSQQKSHKKKYKNSRKNISRNFPAITTRRSRLVYTATHHRHRQKNGKLFI